MDTKPHTLEEDFEHFLSYSNLGHLRKLGPDGVYRGDLLRAFEACWTPLQEAKAEVDACRFLLNDPRVRAIFGRLPDGAVLGSCSGFVLAEQAESGVTLDGANTTSGEPRDIPRAPANPRDPSS